MENYKYIFGPVPSRRMGKSLGISPIKKGTCNYSCIYCQLGRTKKMTNTRTNFFEVKDIIEEFKDYTSKTVDFDVITIVGEGEPSLYLNLKDLILGLKEISKKPIAVITNGGLMADKDLQEALLLCDIVLPSIDATNEKMFKIINRPHGKISYKNSIEALINFSKSFKGKLWLETMLVKDHNDNMEFYKKLKELLVQINYDKLYINTPVRPPAEFYVLEPEELEVKIAASILGGITINSLSSANFYSEVKDTYDAILNIIRRHPMNQFEIESFLQARNINNTENFFARLTKDKQVEVVNYKNYYTYRIR